MATVKVCRCPSVLAHNESILKAATGLSGLLQDSIPADLRCCQGSVAITDQDIEKLCLRLHEIQVTYPAELE